MSNNTYTMFKLLKHNNILQLIPEEARQLPQTCYCESSHFEQCLHCRRCMKILEESQNNKFFSDQSEYKYTWILSPKKDHLQFHLRIIKRYHFHKPL